MKRLIIITACIAMVFSLHAQQTRVLFLGNSYTAFNSLPSLTRLLALSLGDTIEVSSNTPGGYTFNGHSTDLTSMTLIQQGNWDYVVLQEQSQLPSFPPSQVNTESRPYAQALVDSIRFYSPCAEPVFYMTWGRQNGDDANCASWPPVCTYEGMQSQLRISYLSFAEENMAWCAPVGAAWAQVREQYTMINLYNADGSHPSVEGSYLAACTIYSTMFGTSSVGASYISLVAADTASTLQQIASALVLDSAATWNIGASDPVASVFVDDNNGLDAQFSQTSTNATSHLWDLGDGSTSTEDAFTHTYAQPGSYTVIYTVTDACDRTDTDTLQVTVVVSGINEFREEQLTITPNGSGIIVKNNGSTGTFQLFDSSGKLMNSFKLKVSGMLNIPLTDSGTYLWKFIDLNGTQAAGKVANIN
ncbi:MAG: PKD domain-containing protein [Flavobacteriales bacterium]|nr:PKD domain-containing protein [Flavobacteriales bacterium]